MDKKVITIAISTIISLSTLSPAIANTKQTQNNHEMGQVKGMEKCYGIAVAGLNDCSSANHSCAGEAKMNSDKNTWLLVPTGLCKKIVGGSTKAENS